ncbi:MAG TPA: pyridoxamine 5'-phosphate oxidase family protein [Streptosporangiaceae bacterium]|jgi:nitroimidazol reductase NimA-like FMN-containing flavoprotein (pyridoxamine 5'-phosphate oxidase superfamily)
MNDRHNARAAEREDAVEPDLEALGEEACLRLIAAGGIGRIAYTGRHGLVILPLTYAFHQGAVVFRTMPGSAMDEDLRTGIADADYLVAFEVDHVDEHTRTGWSVLIRGTAQHVEDGPGLAALEDARVRPWPGGPRDLYFRIVPTRVTGRAIRHHG